MPRINLLPWREDQRQKRKKEFLIAIAAAVLMGIAVMFGSKLMVQGWIGNQQARNDVLKGEIARLDEQIEEILGLENQKERLLARMEIIEELQRSRPEVVHLFDELVQTLPEGVYLNEVAQNGRRIELKGAAQSSTRVSALMRNIDGSEWLKDPGLDVVETIEQGASRNSRFTVNARQVSLNDDEDGEVLE